MIATKLELPQLLHAARIPGFLGSAGPCITITLPPYHPGEPAATPATRLKSDIRHLEGELRPLRLLESDRAELVQPLRELAEDARLEEGSGWGRVIFRSPEVFAQFQLTGPNAASTVVAGSFAIRPLLAELYVPRLFHILALSKKRVRLLRCRDGNVKALELPRGIPTELDEALALEPPDHDLENRSCAGGAGGARRRIRFGTGSGRETARIHLADFYKLVDRGIQPLLSQGEPPLLLAGVAADSGVYRAISSYENLAHQSIDGSPDFESSGFELLPRAYSILRSEWSRHQAQMLEEAMERAAPGRFSIDVDEILRAAFEGRIRQLYLDEDAVISGIFERKKYSSYGPEDLLNLAAVQTLLHRGEAFNLPGNILPRKAKPAAAIMRF